MRLGNRLIYADGSSQGTTYRDVNNFRLTSESGVPISLGERGGQSTIYMTPYNGTQIVLLDSSGIAHMVDSNEVSIAIGTVVPGACYDIFAYWTGSAVALEKSAAFYGSTRTDAVTAIRGVTVKSSDYTRRLVGTFFATTTSTFEDAYNNRHLCNFDNRVQRRISQCPNYNSDDALSSYSLNSNGSWNTASTSGGYAATYVTQGDRPAELFFHATLTNNGFNPFQQGFANDSVTEAWVAYYHQGGQHRDTTLPLILVRPLGYHFVSMMFAGDLSVQSDEARNGSPQDVKLTIIEGRVWC